MRPGSPSQRRLTYKLLNLLFFFEIEMRVFCTATRFNHIDRFESNKALIKLRIRHANKQSFIIVAYELCW